MTSDEFRSPRSRDERGVSEALSFALVFSLILVSVGVVTVSGFAVLEDVRTGEQVQNAARAYDVLGNNMEDLYAEGAPSRATEIDLGDGQIYLGDTTTVNVTVKYSGGGSDNWTREIRPIIYRVTPGHQLVYENGAVFQTRPNSGAIRQEPPQLFGGDQTIIPMIRTRSDSVESIGSTTVLIRAQMRSESILYSGSNVNGLFINVTSARADLWQRFYEESVGRTNDCKRPTDERVICEIAPGNAVHVTSFDVDISIVS